MQFMQKTAYCSGEGYFMPSPRLINQIIRIMKVISFIMFVCCVQVAAATRGQSVTLKADNLSLKKVFDIIENQTGYVVLSSRGDLAGAKPVTITANDMPLTDFIHTILSNQPLSFIIEGKTIVLSRKPVLPVWTNSNIPIKGYLRDKAGNALVGATLHIKGKTKGTMTASDGSFTIDVEEGNTIIVSYIGFNSITLRVENGKLVSAEKDAVEYGNELYTIRLMPADNKLEEITINGGYYKTTEKLKTGNISKVTSKEIEAQPVTNPLAALQGRIPGVFVQQTSGLPGGAINLQIRGRNSLRDAGNNPLYIIDGVPVTATTLSSSDVSSTILRFPGSSPFNTFNPSDIESIEILKDADATAIYGSRGANGVVLITTKKGKVGKTKVDININQGIGEVSSKMDLLNTQEYLEMRREAYKNDGVVPSSTDFSNRDLFQWDTTRYTDWQKELIGGTAKLTNAQATVSGGNANTQFLLGAGYYRETTVFPGDFSYQKGSIHFNLNHSSDNKKFTTSFLLSYVADRNTLPKVDLTEHALTLSPNAPALYDEDGNLNWENGTWDNPLAAYAEPEYSGRTRNAIANCLIGYNITPDFQIKTSLGYTNIQLKEFSTSPISANNPAYGVTEGYAYYGNNDISTWIIEPQAEYKKQIGKGRLIALLGTTFQQNLQEGQSLSAFGFTNDALLENIKFSTSINPGNFTYSKYRYNAVFGRINYDWEGKYIINLTARRDGSSRFGPDKRFANFGAIGAAWIFSNEGFIKNGLSFLSFGKLRASYGTTGSDQIGDYQYMDTYLAADYPYNNIAGLVPTQLVNPEYSWETNKKMEAALDLGFLEDKVFISVSAYRNRSSNQLVGYSLPVVTGFSSVQFNLPAIVQNSGFELEVTAAIIKTSNFKWTSSANFTAPRNKLVKFPNIEDYPAYANRYEVGKSLNISKRFHYIGVNPETGVYTFEDVNDNGSTRDLPADLQARKESGQKFFGGFSNNISYKGFQLDFFFQYVKQTGSNYLASFLIPGQLSNQPVEVMKRWKKPGDNSDIQMFSRGIFGTPTYYGYYNNGRGDNRISDASFIRLKNVSLSWSLPEVLSNKIKAQQARIYIQGQNLFTVTNYLGLDPETQSSVALPPLRTATAGIQITF